MRISPQTVHDQRAEDHGEVGAADAHLAAEEESRQPAGRVVAPRQAGAFLENRENTEWTLGDGRL